MTIEELKNSKFQVREFLTRRGVAIAPYRVFDDPALAHSYINERKCPLVVKCVGEVDGKGTFVCSIAKEAHIAVHAMMQDREKPFGSAGQQVVIEDLLDGREIHAVSRKDGQIYRLSERARDSKRLDDGSRAAADKAVFSPTPPLSAREKLAISIVVRRIVAGLRQEGLPLVNKVSVGLLLTDSGPVVFSLQ